LDHRGDGGHRENLEIGLVVRSGRLVFLRLRFEITEVTEPQRKKLAGLSFG